MGSSRTKTSDAFIQSCVAYVNHDKSTAFLWALKVVELADRGNLQLTDNEEIYLQDVFDNHRPQDN
jgi:hypothetical protein